MPKSATDRMEQRRQTRAKLIDAAVQLFSTSGYEHATVDDISQAAGFSKGAYYFHFSTKDDILLELLRTWAEARTEILATRSESQDTAVASLEAMLEGFFSYDDARQWPAILLEFWAQAVRNQEVSKRLTAAYAVWRKQITDAFERAAAEGMRAGSAAEASALMLAAHDGHAVQMAIGAPGAKTMKPADLVASLLTPLTRVEETGRRRAAI